MQLPWSTGPAGGGSPNRRRQSSLPLKPFPGRGISFPFLSAFVFSVLTFRFAVFPGGTHPQPQSIFLAIMSPPFVLSLFCRLRSSASADATLCEVRRESINLKTLLRHPDDPLLELLLAVVKPFPQSPLGDAEEPGGVPRRGVCGVHGA